MDGLMDRLKNFKGGGEAAFLNAFLGMGNGQGQQQPYMGALSGQQPPQPQRQPYTPNIQFMGPQAGYPMQRPMGAPMGPQMAQPGTPGPDWRQIMQRSRYPMGFGG